MSVPTDPPKATKVTMVANVSTTSRFPVERSSAASAPPQTRPPVPSRPAPVVQQQSAPSGISKAPSPLRASLEKAAAQPPRAAPSRVIRLGVGSADPPEGIGRGVPPAGGMKVL